LILHLDQWHSHLLQLASIQMLLCSAGRSAKHLSAAGRGVQVARQKLWMNRILATNDQQVDGVALNTVARNHGRVARATRSHHDHLTADQLRLPMHRVPR